MSNNRRGLMKIPAAEFGTATAITTKPSVPGGVKYETIGELKDVVQLDKLDATRGLIVVKTDFGGRRSVGIPGLGLSTAPLEA